MATRAVTIEGTPEEIWPWLLQLGYGRAGFYGYDLIENPGGGRGIRSAETILPDLQQLAVGDDMPISFASSMVVYALEPNRSMVWVDASEPPTSMFSWGLTPVDENRTRLINRFYFRHHWTKPVIVLELFTDFADPVAVRKVLLGVKDRVEGRVEPMARQNAEIALWLVAFLELVAAFVAILVRRSWWRGWLVGAAAVGVLLLVLYVHPPLWFGVLLEIGILMGLLWSFRGASPGRTATARYRGREPVQLRERSES
jgi:hypothetical protein